MPAPSGGVAPGSVAPMTLRRLLVPGLALGVVLLAGCSSTMTDAAVVTPPNPARTDITRIPDREFRDEVEALSSSPALRPTLERNFTLGPPGVSTDARLTAAWLTQWIRQAVVDDEFTRLGLRLPPGAAEAATAEARRQYGPEAWDAFPAAMRERLAGDAARTQAVLRTCLSGRSVAHILVATAAEAREAKAEIASGAPFAEVAERISADPGSKGAGGDLGCLAPDAYVGPFQEAAERAPLGTVVGPVRTQFGYHLILVTEWKPLASPSPAQTQQLQQAATASLEELLTRYDVRVASEYGSWGRIETGDGGSVLAVRAPSVPDPRDGRRSK